MTFAFFVVYPVLLDDLENIRSISQFLFLTCTSGFFIGSIALWCAGVHGRVGFYTMAGFISRRYHYINETGGTKRVSSCDHLEKEDNVFDIASDLANKGMYGHVTYTAA